MGINYYNTFMYIFCYNFTSLSKGGCFMNTCFSIVDLASLIVTIIGLILTFISLKPSISNPSINTKIIINPPNSDSGDSIKKQNDKTRLKLLYSLILLVVIISFILSIYFNSGIIKVKNLTISPALNILYCYMFYGLGAVSKIFIPLVLIFSLALIIRSWIIKNCIDRNLNIITFISLFLVSIPFTFRIFTLNYIELAASFSKSELTLHGLLESYDAFIIFIQAALLAFEVYKMLSMIIVNETSSKLINKTLRRYISKIILPISTLLIILYWNYIL